MSNKQVERIMSKAIEHRGSNGIRHKRHLVSFALAASLNRRKEPPKVTLPKLRCLEEVE